MSNNVYIGTSIDGYISAANGDLDWLSYVPIPEGNDLGFAEFMDRIETRNVAYPFFDDTGTPQSPQSLIIERYTLTNQDSELVWQATITDPQNFKEPVNIGGSLVWNPEEEIKPYNCTLP